MIAAHLTPKDISLWKRLAQLSSEQGLVRQAIYCHTQVGGCRARWQCPSCAATGAARGAACFRLEMVLRQPALLRPPLSCSTARVSLLVAFC